MAPSLDRLFGGGEQRRLRAILIASVLSPLYKTGQIKGMRLTGACNGTDSRFYF